MMMIFSLSLSLRDGGETLNCEAPSVRPGVFPRLTASFLSPAVSLQDDSSVSSEDMNIAEPTWVAAEPPPVPEPSPPKGERVSNPTAAVKEEDGETQSLLY